jgi:hypothetical protein
LDDITNICGAVSKGRLTAGYREVSFPLHAIPFRCAVVMARRQSQQALCRQDGDSTN